jgi:quinol monooxygenase YgiN
MNAIPNKEKECHQTLQLIVERCLAFEGCRDARFAAAPGEKKVFHLTTVWKENADWERFRESDSCKALRGMIHLLTSDSRIATGSLGRRTHHEKTGRHKAGHAENRGAAI